MMTDADLEAIEMRIKAATPAPWCTGSIPWQVWCEGGYGKICRIESTAEDRDFIAHARQDLPEMLAEVRRIRKAFEWASTKREKALEAALERILNIRVQDKQIVDAWKEARQIAFDAFDVSTGRST